MFVYFNKDTKKMTHTCNVNNPSLPDNLIEIEVEDDFDPLFYYTIKNDNTTIVKGEPMIVSKIDE